MPQIFSEAERKKYYQDLPRKRMSAAALIVRENRMLIVKPFYRDAWLIPGGVVEAHESPYDTVSREVKEEIGLNLSIIRPLCFDYMPDQDGKGEAIHFIFEVRASPESQIHVDGAEITDFMWVEMEEAQRLLVPPLAARVLVACRALETGACYCTEQGKIQA